MCLRPLLREGRQPFAPPPDRRRPRPARPAALIVLFVGLLVLAIAVVWLVFFSAPLFLGPVADADSTGRVRVGMHVVAVARALEMEPPPRQSADARTAAQPDLEFTGTILRESDGRVLRVRFRGGSVTGIEEGHSPLAVLNRVEIHYDD
jgi:hypothetical protein